MKKMLVPYRSPAWEQYTKEGWITEHVDGQWAVMVLKATAAYQATQKKNMNLEAVRC